MSSVQRIIRNGAELPDQSVYPHWSLRNRQKNNSKAKLFYLGLDQSKESLARKRRATVGIAALNDSRVMAHF